MKVAYRYLGENGAREQQIITDDLLRGMSLLGENCIDNQILRSNWVPVWHWSDWVTSLIWVNGKNFAAESPPRKGLASGGSFPDDSGLLRRETFTDVTCLDLARCLLAADAEELQLRGNEDDRDSVEIDSVDPNSSEGPSSDDRATCVEEEPLYLTYYRPNWVFEQLPTLSPNSCVCRSWKDRAGGT
ncbi:unnamed protein product [Brassica oleracea]